MPRGFIGRPATAYLTEASSIHSRAMDSGNRITNNAPSNANLRARQLPFEPSEGTSGGFAPAGRGNSSNIVVSQTEHESVSRMISQADDKLGECIYNVSNEVEILCQTAFILPTAVPRCLNISENIKKSLGEFRGVTEDAVLEARKFAQEISDIG